MNFIVFAFLAFFLGAALGAAITFRTTADAYDEALDESYRETLDARRYASELEDLVEKMKPVHCIPSSQVSKIVSIDWDELDFPNSEVRHE